MNKLLSLTISAILLMAVATAVFVSCKKDMREVAFTNQISEKTEAQQVYEKIIKFREAREAYHSEAKTNNGYVSPSEARSILDGAINYEFSCVNRYLEDTKLDTLRYDAPQTNSEGNIAINDLIDIYDSFALSIENDKNSVNYFMINYPQNNIRNEDVEIIFTRGVPGDTEPIPDLDYFAEGENWIWGGGNGNCAHTIFEGDAATKLTEKCQAMLNPNRTGTDGDTINPYNSIYDVDYDCKNYKDLQSLVNGLDYWLFHAENLTPDEASEYCVSYDYLNLYMRNLHAAVISPNGCLHYSTNYHSPIREIIIHWADNGRAGLKDIWHFAEMTYYKYGLPY